MNSEKYKFNKIIEKAENIVDVLLRHMGEEGGCDHKIDTIVEEAFGPSFEGQDHHQNNSNQSKEVTT
jgi:hypothetical protein